MSSKGSTPAHRRETSCRARTGGRVDSLGSDAGVHLGEGVREPGELVRSLPRSYRRPRWGTVCHGQARPATDEDDANAVPQQHLEEQPGREVRRHQTRVAPELEVRISTTTRVARSSRWSGLSASSRHACTQSESSRSTTATSRSRPHSRTSRSTASTPGVDRPVSRRAMALYVIPSRSASCRWLGPDRRRASRTRLLPTPPSGRHNASAVTPREPGARPPAPGEGSWSWRTSPRRRRRCGSTAGAGR